MLNSKSGISVRLGALESGRSLLTGQIVLREIARNAGREEVLRQGPDRAVNVEILDDESGRFKMRENRKFSPSLSLVTRKVSRLRESSSLPLQPRRVHRSLSPSRPSLLLTPHYYS